MRLETLTAESEYFFLGLNYKNLTLNTNSLTFENLSDNDQARILIAQKQHTKKTNAHQPKPNNQTRLSPRDDNLS